MPLGGKPRCLHCERVAPIRRKTASVAKRAKRSRATRAVAYRCLPFVASIAGTAPPHFLIGPDGDVGGGQVAVFRPMPLGRECRSACQKARFRRSAVTRTEGTSVASQTRCWRGSPFVVGTFRALPPCQLIRLRDDDPRRERSVLGRMPLPRDLRCHRRQAVVRAGTESGAKRTSNTFPRTVADDGRPFVVGSFRAFPPDLPVGPRQHVFRPERAVLRLMPLAYEPGEVRYGRHPARVYAASSCGSLVPGWGADIRHIAVPVERSNECLQNCRLVAVADQYANQQGPTQAIIASTASFERSAGALLLHARGVT